MNFMRRSGLFGMSDSYDLENNAMTQSDVHEHGSYDYRSLPPPGVQGRFSGNAPPEFDMMNSLVSPKPFSMVRNNQYRSFSNIYSPNENTNSLSRSSSIASNPLSPTSPRKDPGSFGSLMQSASLSNFANEPVSQEPDFLTKMENKLKSMTPLHESIPKYAKERIYERVTPYQSSSRQYQPFQSPPLSPPLPSNRAPTLTWGPSSPERISPAQIRVRGEIMAPPIVKPLFIESMEYHASSGLNEDNYRTAPQVAPPPPPEPAPEYEVPQYESLVPQVAPPPRPTPEPSAPEYEVPQYEPLVRMEAQWEYSNARKLPPVSSKFNPNPGKPYCPPRLTKLQGELIDPQYSAQFTPHWSTRLTEDRDIVPHWKHNREEKVTVAPHLKSNLREPMATSRPSKEKAVKFEEQPVLAKVQPNPPTINVTYYPQESSEQSIDHPSEFELEQRTAHQFHSNATAQSQSSSAEVPASVKLYDSILDGPLANFITLSNQIGGDVKDFGALTRNAFQAQRVFLWTACGRTKPGDTDMNKMLLPTSEILEKIQSLRNAKRQSASFNHLSAVSESIPALGWVAVTPAPAPFIKEMSDASQFYTNRVLKEFKEKDKIHAEWVKAWLQTLTELQQYVKQNHTTGLVWNSAPGSVAPGGVRAAPASGGAPPPPGPPPPPPPPIPANIMADMQSTGGDEDSRAALFAELNKGLDITKSLKKVTSEMQTHKNPSLRAGDVVPAEQGKPSPNPKPPHLGGAQPAQKSDPTPVCKLEGGKKWVVEFQKGNRNCVIEAENNKQVAYIYKCQDTVIQVKGKINSITVDSCKKTSIVFDGLVSQIEVINSQSIQVQSLGQMPTIAIQKTDGCQVYLSKESVNAEIVTSKSSEMNVLVPDENGEFNEYPVPEIFKTMVKGKKLETTTLEIA